MGTQIIYIPPVTGTEEIVVTLTADTTISAGDILYKNGTNDRVGIADASSESTAPAIGIAMNAATSGNDVDILVIGKYDLAPGSAGDRLFLDYFTAGTLSTAPPEEGPDNFAQPVGIQLNGTESFFNFNYDNNLKPETIAVASSDETTDLAVGDGAIVFRMPFELALFEVRASVTTAPTGSTITIDVEENASSIFSTLLTIDAGEKTSTTAATPPVINGTGAYLADDAEIRVNIDQIGSTVAGAGLKLYFLGIRT